MAEDALKAAKTDWKTAKSAFTRCGKSLAKLIESKRPEQEVREGLNKLQLQSWTKRVENIKNRGYFAHYVLNIAHY